VEFFRQKFFFQQSKPFFSSPTKRFVKNLTDKNENIFRIKAHTIKKDRKIQQVKIHFLLTLRKNTVVLILQIFIPMLYFRFFDAVCRLKTGKDRHPESAQ